MSVSTLGMVNYRNPQERSAKYQRQTRNAVRAQVAQQAFNLEVQRQQLEALNYANMREDLKPNATPAGWYADPGYPGYVRWWDGFSWTHHVEINPQVQP